jgi:hypothetical protein
VHTTAYRSPPEVKLVVSQQRMMDGGEPRMYRTGGGSGISKGESSSWPPTINVVSSPRLLARPDIPECIE